MHHLLPRISRAASRGSVLSGTRFGVLALAALLTSLPSAAQQPVGAAKDQKEPQGGVATGSRS